MVFRNQYTYEHIIEDLEEFQRDFEGEILTDRKYRKLYATDASAYRQMPLAVAYPKHPEDVRRLIRFVKKHNSSIIPRTAGTSLAGQVVGGGIVTDVSRYMNEIIEINPEERWVKVQPGVVLDELNQALKPHGLFFSPETSTANRCMIGGMVGNNACGLHSLVYGSTRDHLVSVKVLNREGDEMEFGPLSKSEFEDKCEQNSVEGEIYRNIENLLTDSKIQQEIQKEFPHPEIRRRNTGYAVDLLLDSAPFTNPEKPFNFSTMLAGSEGTLAFFTELTLSLDPLPPKEKGLVCVHCKTLEDALHGNLVALKHSPMAIELMDKVVMDLSKENISTNKLRFFIEGDPEAMLLVELGGETREEIEAQTREMIADLEKAGYGYHFPLLFGDNIKKVWTLRKAGLGLLSNMPGDAKPVPVVEDVAVRPEDLPDYIVDFKKLFVELGLDCVYYAHIATGELHLRPVINLKEPEGVEMFHKVAHEVAKLVKKYRGSLSGEHGDGRLRGEFIPLMIGKKNYELLKKIKVTWDPENIFNPGKIVDTPMMNTSLRYSKDQVVPEVETFFDFSDQGGYLRSIEKCNGSGDCRKSAKIGGIMCPTFMATQDEYTTTRARANMLREVLTWSGDTNGFGEQDLYDILDLCLSCKGCKSECPSNVDMAKLKAEFLQHYYDIHGTPLKAKMVGHLPTINKLGSRVPFVTNFFLKNSITSALVKSILKFAPERELPTLYKTTLNTWLQKQKVSAASNGKVYLFVDEFTNYNDVYIGMRAFHALTKLGYEVLTTEHDISGRTFISKGMLRRATTIAQKNVEKLYPLISDEIPLVGIEPSAILTFRDEYPELLRDEMQQKAKKLGTHALMFDEFISREIENGKISKDSFTKESIKVKLHGHCQQKAIASTKPTKKILSFPENYKVEEIPSGCCGMAGSFGYEKDHYELSNKIGELVLFPAVREATEDTLIAAPGTSCRSHIKSGTGRNVYHPIEIFNEALI